MTAAELLSQHTPAVQATTVSLRQLLRDIMPELQERVYIGWHGLGYHHPQAGYLCGIFPREDSVRLLFEKGYQLFDSAGIFSGGGKQTRYIEIKTPAAIPRSAITALLLQAAAL